MSRPLICIEIWMLKGWKIMEGAHWAHIEYPEKFNAIARKWLKTLESGSGRIADEL